MITYILPCIYKLMTLAAVSHMTGCFVAVDVDLPEVYNITGNAGFDGNGTLSDGEWHHIAVRRSGTEGSLTVDGNVTGSIY